MILNKTNLIVFLVGIFLGLCTGFFTGKALYDKPFDVGIKTDTVTIHDTIPDIAPTPKDSVRTKWVTKWLPSATKTDTITRWDYFVVHDSVAVEMPITTKHYGNEQYDAYISGFEPSLDSIKVYQRTEYITERITVSKPPNKFELDAVAGVDYNVTTRKLCSPYLCGELMYKPSRLQFGIRGGVVKNDKADPFVGAVIKYRIF